MKVMQLLPELNSGGVERGTLEIARALVAAGHESLVVSNGGRMVSQLEAEGSTHLTLAVHKKALSSLWQIRPLRKLILQHQPDIVHVRSRVPAWLTHFALKRHSCKANVHILISTVHGFYSINRYSQIMTQSGKSHCGIGQRGANTSRSTTKTAPPKILCGFIVVLTLLRFHMAINPQHSGSIKRLKTFLN